MGRTMVRPNMAIFYGVKIPATPWSGPVKDYMFFITVVSANILLLQR
ncbi:MAG: hypothetical protein K2M39_07130 [Muribaculaceae bacterium]|nr:hypothetical protein [Muribaculaceae bacterium]